MKIVKGYKAFNKDLSCQNFKFEIGKTYEIAGELKMCSSGFHYCSELYNVYGYYSKNLETRICEIEALGEVQTENDKSCTSKIKIVRELSHSEILELFMKNGNSGDWNSGDWNSGDGNSGYRNSGNRNSGYGNSGDWNSGDGNSGYGNSGYGNSGNRNSGDWNSGDGNSGYFNTVVPVYLFNKPSTMVYTKELENKIRSLTVKPILSWIYTDSMTEDEKQANPSHKTTGGFLRKTNRHDWTKLTDLDKEFILSLPNYDDEVFKVISNGISLLEAKTIKVNHEGKEFEIDIEQAKKLGIIK